MTVGMQERIEEEFISMDRIAGIAKRNVGIMAAAFIAVVASAFAYALLTKPVFKVSSKFITTNAQGRNKELAILSQLANIQSPASPALADPSNYFPDLLKDDAFLSTTLYRRFPIKSDSTTLEKYWGMTPDTAVQGGDWRYVHEKRLLERLKAKHLNIIREDNGLISLETYFDSPVVALEINRMVLFQLGDYLTNKMKSNLGNSRKFIESQMEEAAARLAQSEKNLTEFNMKNLMAASPVTLGEQRKLIREVSINQELYLELKKQFFLSRIEEVKNTPSIEIISQPTLPISRHTPKRTLIVIGGALMGLLLAFPIALVRDWFR